MSESDYLTIDEACLYFKLSRNTIRSLVKKAPEGCSWRVGKIVRIFRATFNAWLLTNPTRPKTRSKRAQETVADSSVSATINSGD